MAVTNGEITKITIAPYRGTTALEADVKMLVQGQDGPDRDVRPWLAEAFAARPDLDSDLAALEPAALDDVMVVVTNLAHAYRWAAMPAPASGRAQLRVDLPAGLARLWGRLAARLGVPRCGNLYHMVLHNWRVEDLPAG